MGFIKLREVGVLLLLCLFSVQEPFKWHEVFRVVSGGAIQFQNLGLNAKIFGTVSDSLGLDLRDYFWTVRNWVLGTVLDSPELNYWTVFEKSGTEFLRLF